jgi:hypothetical protein
MYGVADEEMLAYLQLPIGDARMQGYGCVE